MRIHRVSSSHLVQILTQIAEKVVKPGLIISEGFIKE